MFEIPTGRKSTRSWEAVQMDKTPALDGAVHLSRYPFPFTAGRQIQVTVTIQFWTFITVGWFQSFTKSFQIHFTIVSTIMNLTSSGGSR